MKTETDNYNESNYSIYTRDSNHRTTTGYFPLLKFNEKLYNSCQRKLSNFINHRKSDIRLIINKKINQQISLNDYINTTSNCTSANELTPIPFISKRKIKNKVENKELKNYQRNVVLMRRLEYSNKMKEKKLKQKYNNKMKNIIYLQKMIRGYLVRKIIKQVNIIKVTLANFIFLINCCIRKKYYKVFKNKIKNMKEKNNLMNKIKYTADNEEINRSDEVTIKNDHIKNIKNIVNEDNDFKQIKDNNYNNTNNNNNITNEMLNNVEINNNKIKIESIKDYKDNTYKKKTNNSNEKINTNIPKIKYNISPFRPVEKPQDSVIINDEYIDFSCKESNKIDNKKDLNKNFHNRNPKNNHLYLSELSTFSEIKKANTEKIQRQFRKYLTRKGYYGKYDKRKIAIIYLIKNMVVYIIRPYVLNILKLCYKLTKNITATQEDNFFNITTERIRHVNKVYKTAKNEIK